MVELLIRYIPYSINYVCLGVVESKIFQEKVEIFLKIGNVLPSNSPLAPLGQVCQICFDYLNFHFALFKIHLFMNLLLPAHYIALYITHVIHDNDYHV